MADSPNTALSPEQQKQLIQIADDINSAALMFEAVVLALQSHRVPADVTNALTWVCKSGLEQLEVIELAISDFAREPEFRDRERGLQKGEVAAATP